MKMEEDVQLSKTRQLKRAGAIDRLVRLKYFKHFLFIIQGEYSIMVTHWRTHPDIERLKPRRCSDPNTLSILIGRGEAFICGMP